MIMRSILIVLFLSFILTPLHASENIPEDPCERFLARPSGFSNEALYGNVRRYCKKNIEFLLKKEWSKVWERRVGVRFASIDEALRSLNSILIDKDGTEPKTQDFEIMILPQIILKLQEGISDFEILSQNIPSLYHQAQSYIRYLKDIIRWVDGYIASFYLRAPVGFGEKFYLAQIYFGTTEVQILALTKLIQYYGISHPSSTQAVLRKFLWNKPSLRQKVVALLKKKGDFSPQVQSLFSP